MFDRVLMRLLHEIQSVVTVQLNGIEDNGAFGVVLHHHVAHQIVNGILNPTVFRVDEDALLALVRKKLRSEFNFPRNAQRYFSVPAVYSLENVRYPQADGSVCGTGPGGVS